MRVAILTAGAGWHVRQLERALTARGHARQVLPVTAIVGRVGPGTCLEIGEQRLGECDAALVRSIPRGSLEQIVFRLSALHLLAAGGVRVVNSPGTVERTVDKFHTSCLLAHAGVTTPRTYACEGFDAALAAFEELGGDVVVKPLFGSMGRGLMRVQDPDLAYRVFRTLQLQRSVFYLQEMLPHPGRDIRAFVVGDRVLAAIERTAEGWRTNVARGARARAVELTRQQEQLCLRAARVVGADYAGVDLLPTPDGADHVLEVNGIPGWQAVQTATGVDVAAELVAHVEAMTRAGG